MRIAVDDRRLVSANGTGVAVYAQVLRDTLEEMGAAVERVADHAGADRPLVQPGRLRRALNALGSAPRTLDQVAAPGEPARGWFRADLFREAQVHFDLYGRLMPVACAASPDLAHWTYPVPLRLLGTRNLYTVHDAIPLEHPDLTPIRAGRHRRLLDAIFAAADHIVTVSQSSRDALVRLGWPVDRISNAYQAVDVGMVGAGAGPDALPAGLRPGRYLLACGTVEPRKNIRRLLAAHQASGARLPLVLAGPDGWRAGDELAGAAAGQVVRLPWCPRPTLLALIAQARAVLAVSLAEGFGLTAVEAMALGAPVLCSNRGALAEVVGEGGLQVDPLDVGALAQAIAALAEDDVLCRALARSGARRAAAFARPLYGARLAEIYRAVLGRSDPPPEARRGE